MKKLKQISFEVGIELFGKTLFIECNPFCWRFPFCIIPDGKPCLCSAPHLFIGPFHFWVFSGGSDFGLTFELSKNHFIADKLTVPYGHKRIF